MHRLPLFIEVISPSQHNGVTVCRKIVAELFRQKIAPLPFASSLKEAREVLAAMKAKGQRPSIFIINTFEAESVLAELDPLLGNTPTLFLLRQIFSETSVMMNAAFGNLPHDSIGTILQKMTPRPNSVWTYGSKTADAVALKAAKALVEVFADGDFFHVERHSQIQAQLMQLLKNAHADDSLSASSSTTQAPSVSASRLPVQPNPPAGKPLEPAKRPSARLPAASGGTAINGFIEQLGVSSILMMFEMEKKSGELVVSRRGETAHLSLQGGRIVRASVDGLTVPLSSQSGPESVYYALTWTEGSFQFIPRQTDFEDEIKLPTTHFLMEAARRSDQPAHKIG